MAKIGIFAGTFDPVHAGHVTFVHAAIEALKLNKVIVIPEQKPRHKHNVTPVAHRKGMLQLAFAHNQAVEVRELAAPYATFRALRSSMKDQHDIHLLMGSDVVTTLANWHGYKQYLPDMSLVIGLRSNDSQAEVASCIENLEVKPKKYIILQTSSANISSSHARKSNQAVLPQIAHYIDHHVLYSKN